jgi:hypothetical protein
VNWKTPPFDHAGRWVKCIPSIMNPLDNVTWPQFVMEMVVFARIKIFGKKNNKWAIRTGPGWSKQVGPDVRKIVQQAHIICNFFPHPNDDPAVPIAFRQFFRKHLPLTIGAYRKTRVDQNGKVMITKAEKDIILGLSEEYKAVKNKLAPQQMIKPTEIKTQAESPPLIEMEQSRVFQQMKIGQKKSPLMD